MKVAIIGNMNNNGFALMRYFRDLGSDAHLFLYKNDGIGAHSHFAIEADAWNSVVWLRYIHRIDVENSLTSLQHPLVLRILRETRQLRHRKSNADISDYMPIDIAKVKCTLVDFDYIVCSGIAPAILHKIGRRADIYYPYSTGVEFLGNIDTVKRMSFIKRIYGHIGRKWQSFGLQRSRFILNAEMSVTADVLRRHGLPFIPLAIPMVYNREVNDSGNYSPEIAETISVFNEQDFIIFSHARHFWKNPSNIAKEDWSESKNTDWLINAFASFLQKRPKLRSKLVFLEYGPDVEASKELISRLGIGTHILWLKKMPRKNLMVLLNYSTVGVGEFRTQEKIIWGGTAWEVLAAGKPLLQSLNFEGHKFQESFGYPPPPMLQVRNQEDILAHLQDLADHPEKGKEMGRGAREWFNQHNGIGLAEQWLNLLNEPLANAQSKKQ